MNISPQGIAELADYEDLMLQPYLDSGGVKTVGIGSTISDVPDLPKWPWTKTITIEEAVAIYKQGLKKYEAAVNAALKVKVEQHQFDALVSICYNIGTAGMRGSTFMKRLNAGLSSDQVVSAMKAWNKDNGKVVQGLVNRRKYEADLFLSGRYKSGGYVDLIPTDARHKPVYRLGKRINLVPYI